ncbi:MAG: hypothetical protein RRB51_10500 [Thermoproteus sp.]|nr:hypothetical protein [Thermoproteus sp.]
MLPPPRAVKWVQPPGRGVRSWSRVDKAAARLRRLLEALRPNVETRTILEGQAAGIAVRYAGSL